MLVPTLEDAGMAGVREIRVFQASSQNKDGFFAAGNIVNESADWTTFLHNLKDVPVTG